MKICHVCNAECNDDMELCSVCGADLTAKTEEVKPEEETIILLNNPTLVASFEDVVSAEIFKDLLNENGIKYTCDTLEEGTMQVTFGGTFFADDIYVDESDYEKAQKIYDEFLESEAKFDDEFFEQEFEEED